MRPNCETDRRLVDQVAQIWVDGGGDAEGLDWLHSGIKERIQEIIDERTSQKEDSK